MVWHPKDYPSPWFDILPGPFNPRDLEDVLLKIFKKAQGEDKITTHAAILAEFTRLVEKAKNLKFELIQTEGLSFQEEFSLKSEVTRATPYTTTCLHDVEAFLLGVEAQKKVVREEQWQEEKKKNREERERKEREQKAEALKEFKSWLEDTLGNTTLPPYEEPLIIALWNEFCLNRDEAPEYEFDNKDTPQDNIQFDSCDKILIRARQVDMEKANAALEKLKTVSPAWEALLSKWSAIHWVYNTANKTRKIQAILRKALV